MCPYTLAYARNILWARPPMFIFRNFRNTVTTITFSHIVTITLDHILKNDLAHHCFLRHPFLAVPVNTFGMLVYTKEYTFLLL
jgi:hypothetical protein